MGVNYSTSAALSRKVGLSLDFYNPVHCVTIIAFYIFPFLMCNSFKSFYVFKRKIKQKFFSDNWDFCNLVF